MAGHRPLLRDRLLAGGSAAACALAFSASTAAMPQHGAAVSGGSPVGDPRAIIRLAQASGLSRGGYRQQPVRDQDVARERVQKGELWRLNDLLDRARQVGGGEYMGVEPQDMGDRYRFKFRRSGGSVVWVDMDGRTGEVLAVRN
jgi:hypothetical protein